jgi:nitrous oxidase accessory protein NosD
MMTWTPEAQQRLHRVPAGFMRDMTRTRIEDLAKEQGADVVTLETAEQAIAKARELMQETIGAYMQNTSAARQAMREPAESPGD